MPRRGYPLEGPRAGGIARLADQAGISRAALSRIISGQADASPETMRALGAKLGYTLGEMLVVAEFADPAELRVREAIEADKTAHREDEPASAEGEPAWLITPPDDLWNGLVWDELTPGQRYIWHMPGEPPETRFKLAELYKLLVIDTPAKVDQIIRGADPMSDRLQSRGSNSA